MYQITARKPGRLVVRYASRLDKALEEFTRLESEGFTPHIDHVTHKTRSFANNVDLIQ